MLNCHVTSHTNNIGLIHGQAIIYELSELQPLLCSNTWHIVSGLCSSHIKQVSTTQIFGHFVMPCYSSGPGLLCIAHPMHWQSSPQGQLAVSPAHESPNG